VEKAAEKKSSRKTERRECKRFNLKC